MMDLDDRSNRQLYVYDTLKHRWQTYVIDPNDTETFDFPARTEEDEEKKDTHTHTHREKSCQLDMIQF